MLRIQKRAMMLNNNQSATVVDVDVADVMCILQLLCIAVVGDSTPLFGPKVSVAHVHGHRFIQLHQHAVLLTPVLFSSPLPVVPQLQQFLRSVSIGCE